MNFISVIFCAENDSFEAEFRKRYLASGPEPTLNQINHINLVAGAERQGLCSQQMLMEILMQLATLVMPLHLKLSEKFPKLPAMNSILAQVDKLS